MDVIADKGSRLTGALALVLVGASAAQAAEISAPSIRAFKPVADTYVTADQPRRNFGRTKALRADGAPQATVYLRFRMRKVEGKLESVTLLLHAESGARAFQVRRVREDDWREAQLTYRTAPKLSLRYAASRPVRRGKWSAVDVTPLFETDDDEQVSLAITTRSPVGVVFASRESKKGPRLVVRTERPEPDDVGDEPRKPYKPRIQVHSPAP